MADWMNPSNPSDLNYYIWDFENRTFTEGKESLTLPGNAIEGLTSTFQNDSASSDGILLDAAGDEVWFGNNVTGTRILGGGVNSGFKIQQIEFKPDEFLRVYGENCTYFRCNNSPTDIVGVLDVSNLTNLVQLICATNSFTSIDLSNLTSLLNVYCYDNNISSLDITNTTSMTSLYCYTNSISELDVSTSTNLVNLSCAGNSIQELNVANLTSLELFHCYNNSISTLDISNLTAVDDFRCDGNGISTYEINNIVNDLYDTWIANPRTGTANIGGTNSYPSGIYQSPAVPGAPTPKEKIWLMVNDATNPWTITYTAGSDPVLPSSDTTTLTSSPADLIDYYKAKNGELPPGDGDWYINYDKRHSLKIYSDYEAIDEHSDTMIVPATPSETESFSVFSDKLEQKFNNTKITTQSDGTEIVELDLDDRIVTFLIDQSGSMTWNDNSKFRHIVAQDIADKIESSYPGEIRYNLIEFGSKFVNVILFGVLEEDIDVNDPDIIENALTIDDNENFRGIRVVRTTEDKDLSYNPAGGELISDGFIGKILDGDIVEGITYYYWVYTYDKDFRISKGRRITVTPRERIVPRGVSTFRSFVDNEDITRGTTLIGTGVSKDDNTIGIWHLNEGMGTKSFDFSSSNNILTTNNTEPIWYDSSFVPTGTSGIFFNGVTDYIRGTDANGNTTVPFNSSDDQISIIAWVFPYSKSSNRTILYAGDDSSPNYLFGINSDNYLYFTQGGSTATTAFLTVNNNMWQHVAAVFNGTSSEVTFYVNGSSEQVSLTKSAWSTSDTYYISIGSEIDDTFYFKGKMTEISIHDTVRSASYISSQQIIQNILDNDNNIVGTEIVGIKDDNGDRLVAIKYEISEDYDFIGGNVKVVRNNERIPEWEGDGDLIYYQLGTPGTHYIADPNNVVIGDNVYYRIYSENRMGNHSFASDSLSLTFDVPIASSDAGFPSLTSPIPAPIQRTSIPITTPGDRKIAIKWGQTTPLDDRIEKVKIYYSRRNYPVVNDDGGSDGELIFNGSTSDNVFVHRDLDNDQEYYYTIVNVDKYGRSSNYDSDGNTYEDFLHGLATPKSGLDESTIPLLDVENLHYELVDDDSVSVIWNQPIKNSEDINAYFDQTVIVYTSITDQFGTAFPEDTPMKMYIDSTIIRDDQADDVFNTKGVVEFQDRDAYSFNVIRTDDGILKGTLSMTQNADIIASIRRASFEIQVKAYVPKTGYISPTDNTVITTPLEEFAPQQTEGETGEIVVEDTSVTGENIFEYFSKKITINYTNPWEVELVNKENMQVPQRCYVEQRDPITKERTLASSTQFFNGIYMKASAPFVARAKIKYKGEPVETGTLQIAVWDADSDNLCRNAGVSGSTPYEGEKIQVSTTVLPPSETLPILQGEEIIQSGGEDIIVPISYVDIPLYAPDQPHAVRLFVKGSRAGYNSVKDMYILFQSVLKIDIQAFSPAVDGSSLAEQQAQVYIVNPDYPNINLPYDKSLVTYPDDNSVVQWESLPIKGNKRDIYSIDNVPIPGGIYSYTRSGVARNIFMGPVERGANKIDETHEIRATIVYNGLSAQARQYIQIDYEPEEYNKFSARFLMEVDGGWIGDGLDARWGGAGWLNVKNSTLWTDGSDYKRIKISRNPRIATASEFGAASCFRDCVNQEDSEVLELSSGQIVYVNTGDEELEILHGDITEVTDPYTGEHSLVVGEDGLVENKDAYITLKDQEDSDTTYFYVRANKFVPNSQGINPEYEVDEEPINECLCLNGQKGLFLKDLPKWTPVVYLDGTTTVFVNNRPLTLIGGGDFYNGIPPCPIGLKEPLSMLITERRVVTDGETFWVDNNQFLDPDGKSYIEDNSDVFVKVLIKWRKGPIPEGTTINVLIGEGNVNNLFASSQDRYFAEIDDDDGMTYVTVQLYASRVAKETTTEKIRIFTDYDENKKTDRDVGVQISLTIDRENETIIEAPVVEEVEDVDPPVETPYSRTLDRYDIDNNEWTTVNNMLESRGDSFIGTVGDYIYVMGGLRSNDMDISSRNERYNIVTDVWDTASPMVTPRFGGSSVTVGNDIYTIGGVGRDTSENGELDVSIAMEVYHADSDNWEILSSMPISDEGTYAEIKRGVAFGTAKLVTLQNKNYIYVLCGVRSVIDSGVKVETENFNDVILRYDIEEDGWEISQILYSDELLTYSRTSPLSIVYDNKIVVFNGAVEDSNSISFPNDDFTVELYDNITSRPSGDRYVTFGSGFFSRMPIPKYLSAFTEYDVNPSSEPATYYILGGYNNDSSSLDVMERIITINPPFYFDTTYDVSDPSLSLTSLPTAKHGAKAVYVEALRGSDLVPYIYLIGGYTSARGTESVEITFDI